MTGQDELQHLEAELAAGRISAEDYRARRDEVLRRAPSERGDHPSRTSDGNDSPGDDWAGDDWAGDDWAAGSPSEYPTSRGATSGGATSSSAVPQNPFPPAFSWNDASTEDQPEGATGQGAASEKATEFVLPLAQPTEAGGRTAADPDSEPTRFVHVDPSAQRSAEPRPAPQNWHNWQPRPGPEAQPGAAPSGTPRANSDLPSEHGNSSRARQGREVFDAAGKSSRGKLVGGILVGSVLVLAIAAAITTYAATSSDEPVDDAGTVEQPPQAPPAPPAPQAPPAPPEPPAPTEPPAVKPPPASSQEVLVAAPPGPAHPLAGALDRPALEGPKGVLLSPEVRDYALQHGVVDGWFNGTDVPPPGTPPMPKTTLLAVRMPDQDAASGLADAYRAGQAELAPADDLSYRGAEVLSDGNGTLRTAYVVHGWTVIVDVSGDQRESSTDLFTSVLDQQLAQSPPTVRS